MLHMLPVSVQDNLIWMDKNDEDSDLVFGGVEDSDDPDYGTFRYADCVVGKLDAALGAMNGTLTNYAADG